MDSETSPKSHVKVVSSAIGKETIQDILSWLNLGENIALNYFTVLDPSVSKKITEELNPLLPFVPKGEPMVCHPTYMHFFSHLSSAHILLTYGNVEDATLEPVSLQGGDLVILSPEEGILFDALRCAFTIISFFEGPPPDNVYTKQLSYSDEEILFSACRSGDMKTITSVLSHSPPLVCIYTYITALKTCVYEDQMEAFSYLLNSYLNTRSHTDGEESKLPVSFLTELASYLEFERDMDGPESSSYTPFIQALFKLDQH